jgi:histidinol phosphatase-like enzyme
MAHAETGTPAFLFDLDGTLIDSVFRAWAKPDPDLFLAAADLLGVDVARTMIIGDSTWDMRLRVRSPRTVRAVFAGSEIQPSDALDAHFWPPS